MNRHSGGSHPNWGYDCLIANRKMDFNEGHFPLQWIGLRWTQVIVGSVGKGREGQLKDDSGDLCRWAKGLSRLFSSTTNSTCSTTSQSRHIDDLHIFDEETCWRRRLYCNATDLEQKLPPGTHCSARAFSSHRSFHLIFQHELSTFPRNFYCLTHIFFKCLYKQCTIAPNRWLWSEALYGIVVLLFSTY